jgi:hypothetical protein
MPAVTSTWLACTLTLAGVWIETPLLSTVIVVPAALISTLPPPASVHSPLTPPGVVSLIVSWPEVSSTMATRVPALPLMVQRSTRSPEPPNVSGGCAAPFHNPPRTIHTRASRLTGRARTSSPTSGNINAPRFWPAKGCATRAQRGPSWLATPSTLSSRIWTRPSPWESWTEITSARALDSDSPGNGISNGWVDISWPPGTRIRPQSRSRSRPSRRSGARPASHNMYC